MNKNPDFNNTICFGIIGVILLFGLIIFGKSDSIENDTVSPGSVPLLSTPECVDPSVADNTIDNQKVDHVTTSTLNVRGEVEVRRQAFCMEGLIASVTLQSLVFLRNFVAKQWKRFSTPASSVLLGDINRDGVVNTQDVDPLIDLIISGGFQVEADINRDGVVNVQDVEPFADLLVDN